MPYIFTIEPAGFSAIKKAIITRLTMVYGFLILLIVGLHFLNPPTPDTPNTWPYLILMLTGVMVFSTFMNLKRQKLTYASFRLTVTDDGITREILNTPAITILNKNVSEIVKDAKGGFTIIGKSKLNAIGVPAQINDAEALERLLSDIRPLIVRETIPWITKLQWPIAFLIVAMIFLGFISDSLILSAISVVGFCSLLLGYFILVQVSKNFDRRIKRWSYVLWIPLIAVAAGFIMRLITAGPSH